MTLDEERIGSGAHSLLVNSQLFSIFFVVFCFVKFVASGSKPLGHNRVLLVIVGKCHLTREYSKVC